MQPLGLNGLARGGVANERQPTPENGTQPVKRHGLPQIGVHASSETALLLTAHRIGGDSYNRGSRRTSLDFARPESVDKLIAVHQWHMDVGENCRIIPIGGCG